MQGANLRWEIGSIETSGVPGDLGGGGGRPWSNFHHDAPCTIDRRGPLITNDQLCSFLSVALGCPRKPRDDLIGFRFALTMSWSVVPLFGLLRESI